MQKWLKKANYISKLRLRFRSTPLKSAKIDTSASKFRWNYAELWISLTDQKHMNQSWVKFSRFLPFKSCDELFGVRPLGCTGEVPTFVKSIVKTELFKSPFPNFPRIWSTSVIKSSMRSIALYSLIFKKYSIGWTGLFVSVGHVVRVTQHNFSIVLKILSLVI